MGDRAGLSRMLKNALVESGMTTDLAEGRVYFQPKPGYKLSYPCIIYALSDIDTKFADNVPYLHQRKYTITVIDRNPDSKIPDKILHFPRCSFDRPYTVDNLHHWVFTIFY